MAGKCNHEDPLCSAIVITRPQPLVLCEQPAASRSFAAGSLPLRQSSVGQRPPDHCLRSRSSVRLRRGVTWALSLQTSAGVNPAGSLPGAQDAAVPAAGADRVGTSPPQTAPERWCKAFGHDLSTSGHRCDEPSRLRPVRPSVSPQCRSPPLRCRAAQRPANASAPEPATSHAPDRLPGQPPLRSGSYGTGRLTAAAHTHRTTPSGCETASTIGQPSSLWPTVSANSSDLPSNDRKERG